MNYKLISAMAWGVRARKETICTKVVKDGWDYYVSDTNSKRGWFYCYRTKSLFQDEGCDINCCNSDINVLATNNPNIDGLPKVVDEVEMLAKEIYSNLNQKAIKERFAFIQGYNKAKETSSNADEDMIEFLDWKEKNHYVFTSDGFTKIGIYTTKELMEIWKKQRAKIVYYE